MRATDRSTIGPAINAMDRTTAGGSMKTTPANAGARDKLEDDLKLVMAETEELLKATAGQAGEKLQSVRERVEATIASAKNRVGGLEQAAVDGVLAAGKAADRYVHESPWPAIGIAAGLGLIVGWIAGRK
jgi:ElaB/YqjD/DUF883 family membrane-anchored ribosome-binding protein